MTLTLFFLALAIGLLALNLYFPRFRPAPLATLSFGAGWLTGELAAHHLVVQIGLVFVLVWADAAQGFVGAVSLLVCMLSWIALTAFFITSHRAREEIDGALTRAFGEDMTDTIKQEFRSRFPVEPSWRAVRRPFDLRDPEVEVIKDVPFGHHRQTLDVYRPKHVVENAPVLMQIHGGGWMQNWGTKDHQGRPLMNHMAKRGWVCVANSYRLSPGATFPDHLIDCKTALAWIRTHIREFGGNPDFVVVTGGSAGGHLATMMALTANDVRLQPGFEDVDTSLQAAIPFYGVYDFTDHYRLQKNTGMKKLVSTMVMKRPLPEATAVDDPVAAENQQAYRDASPLFRVRENAPPFLIVHGEKDTLVPVEEARVFAEALGNTSQNPAAYAEISNAQHAFDLFASVRSEHVKHGVEKFLTYVYSRYLDRQVQRTAHWKV